MMMLRIGSVVKYLEKVLSSNGISISLMKMRSDEVSKIRKDLIVLEEELSYTKKRRDWWKYIEEYLGRTTLGSVALELCIAEKKRLKVLLSTTSEAISGEDIVRAVMLCAAVKHGVGRDVVAGKEVASFISGCIAYKAMSILCSGLPIDSDLLRFLLYVIIGLGVAIAIDKAISRYIQSKIARELNERWLEISSTSIVSAIRTAIDSALAIARTVKASTIISTSIGLLYLATYARKREGMEILGIAFRRYSEK